MSETKCTKENRLCGSAGMCGARSDKGWNCSRNLGHDGPHVACGGADCHDDEDHNYATWPTPKAPKKTPQEHADAYLAKLKDRRGCIPDDIDDGIMGEIVTECREAFAAAMNDAKGQP